MTGLWSVAAGTGFVVLERYGSTPGEQRAAAARWPEESRLQPASDRPTLVMFVHPKCTCTTASLAVLDSLLTRAARAPKVIFVLWQPASDRPGWQASPDLEEKATARHATIWRDPVGSEAQRFHATTSGEVFFYDEAHRLAFHGGITASRGQAKPGIGAAAVAALVDHRASRTPTAPAYGCALSAETCHDHEFCRP